jgi:hypothetical protein
VGSAPLPSARRWVAACPWRAEPTPPFIKLYLAQRRVDGSAALSQKYPAGWGSGTQKSVVCRSQQGGYRCAWNYQLNGAHHSGYVLVAVTANNYRLGKVAQAAPASPASSLSPLWYIAIAAVVVIVAIVVAVLRRRRRATATAQ